MFSDVCTTGSDVDQMTYYDGNQMWDQCRRCGTIQVVHHYPDRHGLLVPLCADCAEEGADLLARGRSIVKLRRRPAMVEHRFLEEDYDVIE